MEHNLQVVNPTQFEQACDEIILAIGRLKRSIRPETEETASAPAEPVKKAKAAKPKAEPANVVEVVEEPPAPADDVDLTYEQVSSKVIDFATTRGKSAMLEVYAKFGAKHLRDIAPEDYAALAAALSE
jgi:hypothetical protein